MLGQWHTLSSESPTLPFRSTTSLPPSPFPPLRFALWTLWRPPSSFPKNLVLLRYSSLFQEPSLIEKGSQPTVNSIYRLYWRAPPGLLSTPLIFSSSVALSAGTFPTVSFAAWILAWTHIDHWTMLGEPRSPRLRACLVERDVSFAQVLRVASSSCCSPGHDMLFVDVSG